MPDKEYAPLKLDDKFPFKKHRGIFTEDVIRTDPDYVEWCLNNTSLKFNQDCIDLLEKVLNGEEDDSFDVGSDLPL